MSIQHRTRRQFAGGAVLACILFGCLLMTLLVPLFWGTGLAQDPLPEPTPQAEPAEPAEQPGASAPKKTGVLAESVAMVDECFATAGVCEFCHSNTAQSEALRDSDHRAVSPFDLWRSSMMANATRDPLWRAAVSAEVAANPKNKEFIEAKCLRCHAPMASVERQHAIETIGMDVLYKEGAKHQQLALDGVSCAACHQIDPKKLGTAESFSGGFDIFPGKKIYGPHKEPFPNPMTNFSGGFAPTYSDHVSDSSLCGSCHTLFTRAMKPDGTITDVEFPEQTPYLEWRNSVFNDEISEPGPQARSCQDCHMPRIDDDGVPIKTRIARTPNGRDFGGLPPRDHFSRHLFVGGNTLIPAILRDNREALGVTVPAYAFDATIEAARAQLRERTAKVEIVELKREPGKLSVGVSVQNLAGHKLPSGHPTRRSWLRVVVTNSRGDVLFQSGAHDADGRLVDGAGKLLPSELRGGSYEPHRPLIQSADQVQIYEAVLADLECEVTYSLMRAASYIKDNRLLPLGWRSDHPDAASTAPRGVLADKDFVGGSDVTRYEIPLKTRWRVNVEVTFLHQVLGARFAQELLQWDTAPVREFADYYKRADKTPDVMGQVAQEVPPL